MGKKRWVLAMEWPGCCWRFAAKGSPAHGAYSAKLHDALTYNTKADAVAAMHWWTGVAAYYAPIQIGKLPPMTQARGKRARG